MIVICSDDEFSNISAMTLIKAKILITYSKEGRTTVIKNTYNPNSMALAKNQPLIDLAQMAVQHILDNELD